VAVARNTQGKLVTTDGKTVQGKEGCGVLGVDIFGGYEGVGGTKAGRQAEERLKPTVSAGPQSANDELGRSVTIKLDGPLKRCEPCGANANALTGREPALTLTAWK